MKWGSWNSIHLLWLVPAFMALSPLFARGAKKRLAAFAQLTLARRLATERGGGRGYAKFALFLAAVALVCVALARPQWGAKTMQVKRTGVDVMVALDTSYSMAAEDVAPNRLAKARKEVERLVNELGGNRVGLLVFAGDSAVECPLTTDISTFRMFLNTIGFNAATRGGTDISGAIRKASAAIRSSRARSKAIVLLTDGEDTQGDPLEEAKKAAAEGVKIFAIAIGSEGGAPIPVRDGNGRLAGYKKDRSGQTVFTKMDGAELRKIAGETGGLYVATSGGNLDIQPVIDAILKMEKGDIGDSRFTAYRERFQIPLGAAIGILVLEWLL